MLSLRFLSHRPAVFGVLVAVLAIAVLVSGCVPGTNPQASSTALLFVANPGANNILVFSNLGTIEGDVAPTAVIEGPATELSRPTFILFDKDESLIVTNDGIASISVYENGRTLSGNIPPTRKVEGIATQLVSPGGLAYDPIADELYVADGDIPAILVFADVSTAAFDGDIAPVRKISEPNLITASMSGMALSQDGNLIIADVGFAIHVLIDAASLDGPVNDPNFALTYPRFGSIFDVFVDQDDRLYSTGNRILFWLNPSTPDLVPNLSVQSFTVGIAVDSGGSAYVTDPAENEIEVWGSFATRDPALPADRVIAGATTQLDTPTIVALLP